MTGGGAQKRTAPGEGERVQLALGALLDHVESLIGSQETFPFGPQPAVWRVGGKIFALVSTEGETRVSLKCDPEFARALVAEHPEIVPGYHLNKRHWITVDLAGDLPQDLLEDLVTDSYDLVLAGLPRRLRPSATGRPGPSGATR
jgi:predicted DNA-binding protein (MmcQ/YjbR family)